MGGEVRPGHRPRRPAACTPRPGDVWHLDEVRVVIRGEVHWLWRAVDRHGVVLDEILQRRQDKRAANRLLVTLLKRQGWAPRRLVTDKLASYGRAKRELAPGIEHRSHKGLNNRAENSHLPLRKRERQMQGFRSAGGLQRFTSIFSAVRDLFVPSASKRSALSTYLHRLATFAAGAALLASSPRSDAVARGPPASRSI